MNSVITALPHSRPHWKCIICSCPLPIHPSIFSLLSHGLGCCPDLTLLWYICAIANTVAQVKCGHAGFLCALSSGNSDVHITDSSQQVHRISNCWLVHVYTSTPCGTMPSYQGARVSHPSTCHLWYFTRVSSAGNKLIWGEKAWVWG